MDSQVNNTHINEWASIHASKHAITQIYKRTNKQTITQQINTRENNKTRNITNMHQDKQANNQSHTQPTQNMCMTTHNQQTAEHIKPQMRRMFVCICVYDRVRCCMGVFVWLCMCIWMGYAHKQTYKHQRKPTNTQTNGQARRHQHTDAE